MRLEFKPQALEDLEYWVSKNPKIAKKLLRLIEQTQKNPYQGLGKPEPLRGQLSGWWSRRIDKEHRLVYCVKEDILVIAQAKGHYS